MPKSFNSDSIIPTPDWAAFGLCFFASEAYKRIEAQSLLYRNFERISEFIKNGQNNLEDLQELWDSAIKACPRQSQPTCLEAQSWTEIAIACNMAFEFDNDGHLLLRV